jgi:hypothetical protein
MHVTPLRGVNRVFAILLTISLPPNLGAQTTLQRDANGRVIITNVNPAPAETAKPSLSPVVPMFQSMAAHLPARLTEGRSSTTRAEFGDPSVSLALYKDAGGKLFAVRPPHAENHGDASFVADAKPLVSESRLAGVYLYSLSADHPPPPVAEGIGPQDEVINDYLGSDTARWHTGVRVYSGVVLHNIDSGVDLTVNLGETNDHYRITAHPGVEMARIVAQFPNGAAAEFLADGGIVTWGQRVRVASPGPHAWQPRADGGEDAVDVHWRPFSGSSPSEIAGFVFSAFDQTRPLNIDFDLPRVVSPDEIGMGPHLGITGAAATGPDGSLIVASKSRTTGFGLFQFVDRSDAQADVVVRKFAPNGQPVFSTVIGGTADDGFTLGGEPMLSVATDREGNVLVAAGTYYAELPVTSATASAGSLGILFVKLGKRGELLDARFDGDLGTPSRLVVARDATVAVIGSGTSPRLEKAITATGFVTAGGQAISSYVAVVAPLRGNSIIYATRMGSLSAPRAVAWEADGKLLVGGSAFATGAKAPGLPTRGGAQSKFNGSMEGFVIKLDPSRTRAHSVLASTFIGGPDTSPEVDEAVSALAVDRDGNVYAGGTTTDAFPTTPNAWQAERRGPDDAFVCKFDGALHAIRWATLIGGSNREQISSMVVDDDERVTVVGTTWSTEFPQLLAPSARAVDRNGSVFVAGLNSIGTKLLWSNVLPAENKLLNAAAPAHGDIVVPQRRWIFDNPEIPFKIGSTALDASYVIVSGPSDRQGPSIVAVKSNIASVLEISGSGFTPDSRVLVGRKPAGNFRFVSASLLRASVPPGAADDVLEVSVVNPDGTSATRDLTRRSIASRVAPGGLRGRPIVAAMAGATLVLLILVAVRRRRRPRKPQPITSGRLPIPRSGPPNRNGRS